MMVVSICLSGTDVHCDRMVHVKSGFKFMV